MREKTTALYGAAIFDGASLHMDRALVLRGDRLGGIVPHNAVPDDAERIELSGGILAPGFVDLQVNGGGGVMFYDDPSVDTLRSIAAAHASLGATSILPTLITQTADKVRAAITAVETAIAEGVPGIVGLHLEGPHLSLARKGAHAPSLIRTMEAADLALLLEAADRIPFLKVTLAPESVSFEQMRRLSDAGILLSLGHTDASYDQCMMSADNGVRCVTHLFNAMSQLGNREPGLVGAALAHGGLSAGLIADLIHVHPVSIHAALRAKAGPGRIFLVSDAMAAAGSGIAQFQLNGRQINRHNGRLTLTDGTLAGADLDLSTALRNIMDVTQQHLEDVLDMATSIPATLIGKQREIGHLCDHAQADLVHLTATGELGAVWQLGRQVL